MAEVNIATVIIAIYGAGLSTVLGILQIVKYLSDKPKLKVSVKPGIRVNSGGLLVELTGDQNELGATPTHIVIDIANIGKRPVTISSGGIRLSGHKNLGFAKTIDKLPKKLEEGESHTLRREIDALKQDLRTKTPNNKPEFIFIRDQTGKEYKSKKFNKEIKNLLE